jgi:hypothetical protein
MISKYKTVRSGISISEDTKKVDSDCNAIAFSNVGDWPCYVSLSGQKVRFYLGQGMTIVFGEETADSTETNLYDVVWDVTYVGGVSKECSVMRTYIDSTNC